MKDKILFLDFDGVLNSTSGMIRRNFDWENDEDDLHEEKIEILNWMFEQCPDMKIILSTSWRKKYSISKITSFLVKKGFKYPESIIGQTAVSLDKYRNATRGQEIEDWVDKHIDEIDTFAILDDADITEFDEKHFVRIYQNYGIDTWDALYVIKILNNDYRENGYLNMPIVLM